MSRPIRSDAIHAKVAEFFERNPDEELTTSDIAIKFGIHKESVSAAVARAVFTGAVSCENMGPGRGNQAIYRKGERA